MRPNDHPQHQEQAQDDLLNEQAAPPLSRIMSADRGPFADKMKGDPFEYEIVGPCEEAEKLTFKVIGFTKKYPTGHPYRKRHQGKIGKRTLTKGKFRFPDKEKYGRLAGKDSWEILSTKLGGPELICDLVKKAEEKEKKKKPDPDTGGPTPQPGAEADAAGAQEETQDQASTTAQIGSLKYWVENGTTGLEDPEFKFDSDDPKAVLGDAVDKYIARDGKRRGYTKYTMGHALKDLPDDQRGTKEHPEPSHALKAALVLMKNSDLYSRYYVNLDSIFTVLRHRKSVKEKMGKDRLSDNDMREFAKFGSKDLANYLGMPFFGALSAPKEDEPEPEEEEKAPEKKAEEKPAEKTVAKLTVPQGDLMGKEIDLAGMKMKITKDKMFVNGKPYVATTKIFGFNKQLGFTKAQGTGDGVILGAGTFGFSDETEVKAADLVKYAKQIMSQGSATITNEEGRDIKITPAQGVSESLHITPQQFNQIILRELKSIGFIKEPQEETMKIKLNQLRQIIREGITQTLEEQGSDSENLDSLILRIIDASGSKVSALKDATAAIPGEAESLYFDEENDDILLFATRDDMLRWERAKVEKERAASQPPPPKSQMDMSAEELLASAKPDYPQYRSGGPGRVLHPAEEAESAQAQRDDLVKQWDRYKSIPGATISFYKMPDDYKSRDRWDRARAGKLFADVDYPSLD